MNRRNFFKNLGAATVGVIVAPAVVVKAIQKAPGPEFTAHDYRGYTFYLKKQPDPVFSEKIKRKLMLGTATHLPYGMAIGL